MLNMSSNTSSSSSSDDESVSSGSYVSSPYQSDEDMYPECMATRFETDVLQIIHHTERDSHNQFRLTEDERMKMSSDEKKGTHIYPKGFREFIASSHKHVQDGLVKLLGDSNAVVYGNSCVLDLLGTRLIPPPSLLFDVCIFRPSDPLLLISVSSEHHPTNWLYNSALARKVKTFIRREVKPNFSLVHGVLKEADFHSEESLKSHVKSFTAQAMQISLPHSLFMDIALCRMIVKNFIIQVQNKTFEAPEGTRPVQPNPPPIQGARPLVISEVNLKKGMQCKEQLQMKQPCPKLTEPSQVDAEGKQLNLQDIGELADIVCHIGVFERKTEGYGTSLPLSGEQETTTAQLISTTDRMTLHDHEITRHKQMFGLPEHSLVSSCGNKILLLYGEDYSQPTDGGKGMQNLRSVLLQIDWIVLWRPLVRLVMNTKKEISYLQTKMDYLHQLLQDITILEQSNATANKVPGTTIPEDAAENKQTVVRRLQDKCRFTTRSPVHRLRQFQLGVMRQTNMLEILRDGIGGDSDRRTTLYKHEAQLEKDYGCVHMLGEVGSSRAYHVVCPPVHFDTHVANTRYCDVTRGGELVNMSPINTYDNVDTTRLQNYCGTRSSAAIPLHPSPADPTSILSGPRYWESHTRVTPRKPIGAWLTLLEVGVCEQSQMDSGVWLFSRPRSWSVRIGGCSKHRSSICTFVYDGEQNVHCSSDTMSNTPGISDCISYGVVVDVTKGRLAFIDLRTEAVLSTITAEFREALCPVFGVGPWTNEYNVRMKLVSGKNIKLTDSKKSLIHKALS